MKHPTDRADRLKLKKKYSLKPTRRKGLSDEYPGTNDETTSEADVGIRVEETQC